MNETTVTGDRARRLPPWAGPWVRGTTGVVAFLLLGYLLNVLLGGAERLVLSWHTDKGQD